MPTFPVVFTLDTSGAYASGEVLADCTLLGQLPAAPGSGHWFSGATLFDLDDQGQALDILLMSRSVSLGTKNGAPSIADADAVASILGVFPVLSTDWSDIGGVRIGSVMTAQMPFPFNLVDGRNIYVGLISRGTGTYTINGISGLFHFTPEPGG